jgi:hypothetical protein
MTTYFRAKYPADQRLEALQLAIDSYRSYDWDGEAVQDILERADIIRCYILTGEII